MRAQDLYAPIQAPITKDFGWSGDTINWMANSNNVAFVVTGAIFTALCPRFPVDFRSFYGRLRADDRWGGGSARVGLAR